jgi:hypothetical protein
MMKSMKEQYGKTKGEDIYYAVEQKMKNKKKKGYAGGGYVNCGASMKPNGKAKK